MLVSALSGFTPAHTRDIPSPVTVRNDRGLSDDEGMGVGDFPGTTSQNDNASILRPSGGGSVVEQEEHAQDMPPVRVRNDQGLSDDESMGDGDFPGTTPQNDSASILRPSGGGSVVKQEEHTQDMPPVTVRNDQGLSDGKSMGDGDFPGTASQDDNASILRPSGGGSVVRLELDRRVADDMEDGTEVTFTDCTGPFFLETLSKSVAGGSVTAEIQYYIWPKSSYPTAPPSL
ncbi:hypothetical protein B0H14DRAFT_2593527 [Mycena olivaceomarginata]|nr:hypothetical protein B0H14DRAFT_2593527 [Mycena olivaceomarginata]